MKIAIYGQTYEPENKPYVEELCRVLSDFKATLVFEERFLDQLRRDFEPKDPQTFSSNDDLDNSFDFMFTLGGDGTIVRAVTYIRELDIPIVGINTGRMGFLATIQKEEISFAIGEILQKDL